MMRAQKGFTLVEIAIVLVIIGLLLGGVLKGQELIENSKIKNLINDMRGTAAAYYSYQDRYKVTPGDDLLASTRFPAPVTNGNGNGIMAGNYNAAACSAANESANFWQHARYAGFVSGVGCVPPTHTAGGILGVQTLTAAQLQTGAANTGMAGFSICAGSVPAKYAQSIDSQLDDGVSNTGVLRVGGAGQNQLPAGTALAAYVGGDSQIYTTCLKG